MRARRGERRPRRWRTRAHRNDPARLTHVRAHYPPVRPGAAAADPGPAVRQRRRAHQRDRQRAVPQAGQGRALRGGGGGGAPAGRQRRADPRRQHGRGPDRFGEGDDPLSQPDHVRAGHRAHPDHGRFLQVERDRGRAEVPAGQERGQLDLAEGRRGGVRRARAQGAALRRRRGGDGVRRTGPGRHLRAQGGDLQPRLPDPDRAGRLPAGRHHLRPEHLRRGHRHRGARQLRSGFHRGHPHHPQDPAALPRVRRRVQRVVLVPRQRNRAPGDPLGVPVPRHRRGHGHGHRQRRRHADLRRPGPGPARARGGRDPQPPPRRHRTPAGDRRALQGQEGPEQRRRPELARKAGTRAAGARAGARRGRLCGTGHRGSAAAVHAPAGRHRRPVDGRHERGRRPVRRRQDVPAAGGEVGAGDEEGGGLPAAVHRSGKAAHRRHRQVQRQDHHGHGQGRRARHRQEHRRRGPGLQQLRRDRPGGDGADPDHPRPRARRERRHHRPVRADHAIAGGNEPRRPRNAAAGLLDAAADRRRHHLARAHRAEDRSALRRADGVGEGRLARGRGGAVADLQGAARRVRGRQRSRLRRDPPASQEPRRRQAPGLAGKGARAALRRRLGRVHPAGAEAARPARVRRLSAARADRPDRLDPVLPGLGTGRQVPGDPQRRGGRPAGQRPVPRRTRDAQAHRRREMADRQGGVRAMAGAGGGG